MVHSEQEKEKALKEKKYKEREKKCVISLHLHQSWKEKEGGDKNIGSVGLGGELESNKWI